MITGKDAQTVAAFLEFAAVGVEQAHAERRIPSDWSPQDAVSPDASVAVADAPNLLRGRRLRPLLRVKSM